MGVQGMRVYGVSPVNGQIILTSFIIANVNGDNRHDELVFFSLNNACELTVGFSIISYHSAKYLYKFYNRQAIFIETDQKKKVVTSQCLFHFFSFPLIFTKKPKIKNKQPTN